MQSERLCTMAQRAIKAPWRREERREISSYDAAEATRLLF